MTRGNKPKPHACPPDRCGWRPDHGLRLHRAWSGAVGVLDDGEWHAKPDLVTAMLAAFDGSTLERVEVGACETILRDARRHEVLEVRIVDRRSQYRLTTEGRQRLDRLDGTLMLPPQTDDVSPIGLVTVDLDTLAATRGVTVRDIRADLAELEGAGFVRRVGATHGGLTLALTMPAGS